MTTTTRAATAALLLALAAPALAQEKGPEQAAPERRPDPTDASRLDLEVAAQSPIEAAALVRSAAKALGAQAWIDPQVTPISVMFSADVGKGGLTWAALKALLDQHDVVIVEGRPQAGGPWLIRAHHRRNLNQKEGPPWRVVPGDQVPANDELVTAVFQVKHGAGASIFATVRGLLTRDTNRIGNILYVQGPERIILVDLASKVRYYREVIEQLDVPAAGPATATHIIQLQFADVTRVANVLWNLHPQTQAAAPAQGQPVVVAPAASGVPPLRITYDARTNQLLLSGPAEQLPAIERVVKALDVQVAERQTSVVIKTFEAKGEPREVSNALSELLYSLEQANAIRLRPRVTVVGRRLVVVVHGSDVARVEEALKVVDP